MTNTELSDLLFDSLALWGVIGRTIVGDDEVRVITESGHDLAIRRADTAARRWSVQILKWPADGPPPARLARPCASVVSLLRTVRALATDRPGFASERPPAGDAR